jgi:hypothetical protein
MIAAVFFFADRNGGTRRALSIAIHREQDCSGLVAGAD